MQKWSPEPFDPSRETVVAGMSPAAVDFTALAGEPETPSAGPGSRAARFRREAGFTGGEAIMAHLTPEERATVFELVEIDVARSYDRKLKDAEREFEARLKEQQGIMRSWAEGFQAAVNAELRDLAAACIDLSLHLASRIARKTVAVDREPLVRALETALFKIPTGSRMNITAHPDDAAWLEQDSELRERLGIGEVQGDRRISRGGCHIEAAGREWDATLEGQLEALTRLVEEKMGTLRAAGDGPVDAPAPFTAPDDGGNPAAVAPETTTTPPVEDPDAAGLE